jgi:hypothetical protein
MYAYIDGVLHIYKKLLKYLFIQYGDRYKKSSIYLSNMEIDTKNQAYCLYMMVTTIQKTIARRIV